MDLSLSNRRGTIGLSLGVRVRAAAVVSAADFYGSGLHAREEIDGRESSSEGPNFSGRNGIREKNAT